MSQSDYAAQFRADLAQWRDLEQSLGETARIVIETCNDDLVCPACAEIAARTWTLADVPMLPYAQCTSDGGCRCWANVEFE